MRPTGKTRNGGSRVKEMSGAHVCVGLCVCVRTCVSVLFVLSYFQFLDFVDVDSFDFLAEEKEHEVGCGESGRS